MAYQETTGSSPDDVISKIATFAAANGWTVVKNTLVGSNRTLVLQAEDASDYIWIWNLANNAIRVTASTGYEESTAVTSQPGYAGNYVEPNIGVGPYTNVFLFGDEEPSPHVHVVIEMSGGQFRHISFGVLDKLGEWTGGTYFDGTTWSTNASFSGSWVYWSHALFDCDSGNQSRYGAVRCDIDDRTNAWAHLYRSASYRALTGLYGGDSSQSGGNGYLTTQFHDRNNPPFSGQVTLGAIRIDIQRPGGFWSPAGVVPNARYLNILRYAPGQEITIGSEVWKVFPMCRKGSGSGVPFSGNHGYAYKKEAA